MRAIANPMRTLVLAGLLMLLAKGAWAQGWTIDVPGSPFTTPVYTAPCEGDGPPNSAAWAIHFRWNGTAYEVWGFVKQGTDVGIVRTGAGGTWFATAEPDGAFYPANAYRLRLYVYQPEALQTFTVVDPE